MHGKTPAVGGTALCAWPDQAAGPHAAISALQPLLPAVHSGACAAGEQALAWARTHSHHRLKPSDAYLLLFTPATAHKPPDTWPPNPCAAGVGRGGLGQGQPGPGAALSSPHAAGGAFQGLPGFGKTC